jgi:hypothetical protein
MSGGQFVNQLAIETGVESERVGTPARTRALSIFQTGAEAGMPAMQHAFGGQIVRGWWPRSTNSVISVRYDSTLDWLGWRAARGVRYVFC